MLGPHSVVGVRMVDACCALLGVTELTDSYPSRRDCAFRSGWVVMRAAGRPGLTAQDCRRMPAASAYADAKAPVCGPPTMHTKPHGASNSNDGQGICVQAGPGLLAAGMWATGQHAASQAFGCHLACSCAGVNIGCLAYRYDA